jgi:hypothetical protein
MKGNNIRLHDCSAGAWLPMPCLSVQASFGAFWRVEQLILSTTPDTPRRPIHVNDTAPPIITSVHGHDNIQLLFDMQAEVDALSVGYNDPLSKAAGNATLEDICFKPMGPGTDTRTLVLHIAHSEFVI